MVGQNSQFRLVVCGMHCGTTGLLAGGSINTTKSFCARIVDAAEGDKTAVVEAGQVRHCGRPSIKHALVYGQKLYTNDQISERHHSHIIDRVQKLKEAVSDCSILSTQHYFQCSDNAGQRCNSLHNSICWQRWRQCLT